MSFFEFPHTRTYDSDLGWLLNQVKKIASAFDEFVDINQIHYADPFEWKISDQYQPNTLVMHDGIIYISKQPVPAGIRIDNNDYWQQMINLDEFAKNLHYYVTPEEFGAVGDGVTDDTEAFIKAFKDGRSIKCRKDAVYRFTSDPIDLPDIYLVQLDGQGCTFIDFSASFNVVNGSWNQSYVSGRSNIKNITFRHESISRAYGLQLAMGCNLENIQIRNYGRFLTIIGQYVDYISMYNITIFDNHSNDYSISLPFLGDQNKIDGIHTTQPASAKTLIANGKKPLSVKNALNGVYEIAQCIADFYDCHFEEGGIIETVPDGSSIHIHDSFFADRTQFPDSALYVNCQFYVTHNYVGTNVNHDYGNMMTEHCKICASRNALLPDSYTNLDQFHPESNAFTYSGNNTINSLYVNNDASSQHRFSNQTGTVSYYGYASVWANSIDGSNYANSAAVRTGTLTANTTDIYLTMAAIYFGSIIHLYRLMPDGTYQRAIVPLTMNRLIDFGNKVNGIPWESVDGLPTVNATNVQLVRGILVCGAAGVNATNVITADRNTTNLKYIP